MKKKELQSSALLILISFIWGFAFIAQMKGMEFIGPFTFNAMRFGLGSISLIPLMKFLQVRRKRKKLLPVVENEYSKNTVKYGMILGSILFTGATLQQVGLLYTTAANAGFITSMYIVLVPILGLFVKHKATIYIWLGAIIAAIGLYFLSITSSFTIGLGDLLQLIGAFFWSIHILCIDNFSKKVDSLKLAATQFATCSILSLVTAFVVEDVVLSNIIKSAVPIFYGGMISVGVAYTLQIFAQKHAKPSHAAIGMSLEAVFAAIAGALFLGETFTGRSYLGMTLMLSGMLISQAESFKRDKKVVPIKIQ